MDPLKKARGNIREVFTSVQGEGIHVGVRMTFIRFRGCNLSCNYCDTSDAQVMEGPFVHGGKVISNPTSIDFLLENVDADIVTLTGGEPLLQTDFAVNLCKRLRAHGKKNYLDTNATLPDALNALIEYVDFVSLDFKVPTATGRPQLWIEHEECLKIAASKDVFVKLVINENLLPRELETACTIIHKVRDTIPLVIQPVFGEEIPGILEIQKKALESLQNVRIIPQMHKFLNLE